MINQLQSAVRESRAFGQQKHALDKDMRHDGRTFSHTAMQSRLDTARNFGKFMTEMHPEITAAVNVRAGHVNEWLNTKATSCSPFTLTRYSSEMRAILKEAGNLYNHNFANEINEIKAPKVEREYEPPRNSHGMDAADIRALHDSYDPGSTGDRACALSHAAGLRAGGIVSVTPADIQIESDRATVTVTEKGGRTRTVSVYDAKDIAELQRIREMVPEQARLVPMQTDSLERSLDRHLEKLGLSDKYHYTSSHAMRKEWAQREYDRYRQDHNKLASIQHTNEALGHGAQRDVDLLGRYVNDIN
jgi:integrase